MHLLCFYRRCPYCYLYVTATATPPNTVRPGSVPWARPSSTDHPCPHHRAHGSGSLLALRCRSFNARLLLFSILYLWFTAKNEIHRLWWPGSHAKPRTHVLHPRARHEGTRGLQKGLQPFWTVQEDCESKRRQQQSGCVYTASWEQSLAHTIPDRT